MSSVPPLSPTPSSQSSLSLYAPDTKCENGQTPSVSPTIVQGLDSDVVLQITHGELMGLEPIDSVEEDDYDLVRPAEKAGANPGGKKHMLEVRSELLFSTHHLRAIFDSPLQLFHFSNYLVQHRKASVALLKYYLDALKALKALEYSNSVARKLGQLPGSQEVSESNESIAMTHNQMLLDVVDRSFELMVQQDLPMYITHVWIQIVSQSIRHRIISTSSRYINEGLAEVFCLTDPSRHDNPIVFMSEEFNRTTQYGVNHVIGRNCRFLQGPSKNALSVTRIRDKLAAGKEHYETFLNYRRDGSPFMNLVMLAPLYDSRGTIRYFLGAQVDVSGLAMDCSGLSALKDIVSDAKPTGQDKDEFVQLAEVFGPQELDVVNSHGGDMFRNIRLQTEDAKAITAEVKDTKSPLPTYAEKPTKRVLLRDPESPTHQSALLNAPELPLQTGTYQNGRLTGVYEHYLLVRPYPSLRILFTSPSMRLPGILQSPLLDRIGGSSKANEQLEHAFARGQAVTANVKWLNGTRMKQNSSMQGLSQPSDTVGNARVQDNGKSRWLHCTPLLGSNGQVGVWMIVMLDAEDGGEQKATPKKIIASSTIKQTVSQARVSRQPSFAQQHKMSQRPLPDTPKSQHRLGLNIVDTGLSVPDSSQRTPALNNSINSAPSIRSLASSINPSQMYRLSNEGSFLSREALERVAKEHRPKERVL